jgi:PAS domain S-box-containing protein
MIIEDEPDLLNRYNRILKREIKEIHALSDPHEALKLCETIKPDAIITDIQMPGMTGLEMISKLQETDPDIPFIVVSAYSTPEYFKEAIRLNAEFYANKPVVMDEIITILETINSRKQMQKQARMHEKLLEDYKLMVDEANFVSKTDTSGHITYINKQFEELTGYSAEELIGRTHNILRHPDVPKAAYYDLWKTLHAGKIWKGVLKNRKKSGETFHISMTIGPLYDENGKVDEFIAISRDITPVMNILEREQQLNDLKNDFLRNISHEIRTPLNHIIGLTGLIIKKIDNPKLQPMAAQVNESGNRIIEIVDSLLQLAQLSSKSYTPKIEATALSDHLQGYLGSFDPLAAAKHLEYRYSIDPYFDTMTPCDFRLVRTVIKSLVSNAITFTGSNGKVSVTVTPDENDLTKIIVTDTGIGIDKAQREIIFDTFHQADTSSTRPYDGLGIGLTLVRWIVDIIGGYVDVQSEPERGSTFTVGLDFKGYVDKTQSESSVETTLQSEQ